MHNELYVWKTPGNQKLTVRRGILVTCPSVPVWSMSWWRSRRRVQRTAVTPALHALVFIAAASSQPAVCLHTAALYKWGVMQSHTPGLKCVQESAGPGRPSGGPWHVARERRAASEVTAVTFYSKTLVMKVWTAAEKHRQKNRSVRNI